IELPHVVGQHHCLVKIHALDGSDANRPVASEQLGLQERPSADARNQVHVNPPSTALDASSEFDATRQRSESSYEPPPSVPVQRCSVSKQVLASRSLRLRSLADSPFVLRSIRRSNRP